jgi:hypothetical protein
MKSIIYHVHGRNVEIPAEYVHLVYMKTRKEIAAEYDKSVWTFYRRIKERILYCLWPKNVQQITSFAFFSSEQTPSFAFSFEGLVVWPDPTNSRADVRGISSHFKHPSFDL